MKARILPTLAPNLPTLPQAKLQAKLTSASQQPHPHPDFTALAVVPREKPHPGAAAREPPRDSAVIAEMRAFVSCMA